MRSNKPIANGGTDVKTCNKKKITSKLDKCFLDKACTGTSTRALSQVKTNATQAQAQEKETF